MYKSNNKFNWDIRLLVTVKVLLATILEMTKWISMIKVALESTCQMVSNIYHTLYGD